MTDSSESLVKRLVASGPGRIRGTIGETIGLTVVLAALTLAIYWRSWSLPLSYDSAWFTSSVHGFSIVDAFTQTGGSGYYRPLTSLLFSWAGMLGQGISPWLHAMSLAVQVANALLLTRFVRALWGQPALWLEGSVGVLFILNPLNIQTVTRASCLDHLWVLLFILAGSLAYSMLRRSGGWKWWVVCGLACGLGFLVHELGVVVGVFCVVYELTLALRERRWAREAWACLWVLGASLGYMLIYSLIPKGQPPDLVWSPNDILLRTLYVIQAIAYPVAFLVNGLQPATVAVAAAGSLTVIATLWALRQAWGRLILAGATLAACALLPSVVRLPADYVLNSTQILYVASAGVAVFWASLILALASRIPRIARAAHLVLLAAIGLAGLWHIQSQLTLAQRVHEPVTALIDRALTLAPSDRLLVVNFPEWVAPPARHFPLGSEGVVLIGPYINGGDLVLANTGLHRQVEMAQVTTPYRSDLPYAYQTFGKQMDRGGLASEVLTATQVLWVNYEPAGLRTDWLGGVRAGDEGQPIAILQQQLGLISVQAEPCRSGWMVTSVWQRVPGVQQPLSATISEFAQVLGADGAKVAQADGALVGGLLPFGQIPSGQEVVDRRFLKPDLPDTPSDLTLYVGLYDYETGLRLPAEDGAGARLEADAVSVPLAPLTSKACR